MLSKIITVPIKASLIAWLFRCSDVNAINYEAGLTAYKAKGYKTVIKKLKFMPSKVIAMHKVILGFCIITARALSKITNKR